MEGKQKCTYGRKIKKTQEDKMGRNKKFTKGISRAKGGLEVSKARKAMKM